MLKYTDMNDALRMRLGKLTMVMVVCNKLEMMDYDPHIDYYFDQTFLYVKCIDLYFKFYRLIAYLFSHL